MTSAAADPSVHKGAPGAGPPDSGGRPVLEFASPRRGRPPLHFADLDPADRRDAVARTGQAGFRAKQLAVQYFGRLTSDLEAMTDIPAAARASLAPLLPPLLTELRTLTADGGTTRKALWRLHDGALVESVLMRYPDRATVCISSQAGCGMACPFCATGQAGLTRNLSVAEIVDQVVRAPADMRAASCRGPGRLSNVVFMGMGEPLANYKAVVKVLHRLADPTPDGLGLSARNITVSTVGLVPRCRPRRRGPAGDARGLAARPRRRTARRIGAGEHAMEGRRGARGCLGLHGGHEPPRVHRVRDDPRHQRPGLAGRSVGPTDQGSARACEPHPAEPDAGLEVDRVPAGRRARLRPHARGPRGLGDRAGPTPTSSTSAPARPTSAATSPPATASTSPPTPARPGSTSGSRTARSATMIVHPTNPDIAFAAVLGHAFGPNPERGVYRTTDGGKTWQQVLPRTPTPAPSTSLRPDQPAHPLRRPVAGAPQALGDDQRRPRQRPVRLPRRRRHLEAARPRRASNTQLNQ